jgi:nitronate monooxygenase
MWPSTQLTKALNIKIPIIQAPMAGGATTPELIAAVSNAGGLGSLAAGYLSASEIKKAIFQIRQLTDKPFAVNVFIPERYTVDLEKIQRMREIIERCCFELDLKIGNVALPYLPSFEEQMNIILEENISILSFTFGIPEQAWLTKFKTKGIITMGTATSRAEALQLEKNDIDIIVAQGSEAGGHRGTFIGTAEDALCEISHLILDLVAHVKTPIVAAGGIMDAKKIVDSLKLGAVGVQMGTAFLSCPESGIHQKYKKLLLSIPQDNTVLTRVFSGKLARGIKNVFITRMNDQEENIPDYPIQNSLTRVMRNEAAKQNNLEFMSLWAGQTAYLSRGLPATELIKVLNNDVINLFNLD